MTCLITPPDYPDQYPARGPIVFLAGPIQGALDWQKDVIRIIHGYDPGIWIANPRRQERSRGDFSTDKYRAQVLWEHHYLTCAGRFGVTLFWLANESEHDCERAYAQTTRFELGEAMAYHRAYNTKMVVGIDTAFTGAKYVRLTFREKAPEVPILESLGSTCKKAIALL